MKPNTEELSERLKAVLSRHLPDVTAIGSLRRLSGGASQETWSFDLQTGDAAIPLILRRMPGGVRSATGGASIPLETEAQVIRAAAASGVPVPAIRAVLEPEDGLGSAYVMDFVAGETIARKILTDEKLAAVRPGLARQCGEILAVVHSVDRSAVASLPSAEPRGLVRQYRDIADAIDAPRPVFELAFRWLEQNAPALREAALVHGDFRNGNLVVDPGGIRAVLDWELAHLGDPMEDLGWICVASWRFGVIDKPVGGFGLREEMFEAYERKSGRVVDPRRVKYWEVFGTLKWGVICQMMYAAFRSGLDGSVERAAIGRRASETEIDLLRLLTGGD